LNGKLAVELQGCAQKRRQHDRLRQKAGHRRGIFMAPEDRVQKRAKLDRTTTNVQAFHLEGDNPVIAGEVEITQFNSGFRHGLLPGA